MVRTRQLTRVTVLLVMSTFVAGCDLGEDSDRRAALEQDALEREIEVALSAFAARSAGAAKRAATVSVNDARPRAPSAAAPSPMARTPAAEPTAEPARRAAESGDKTADAEPARETEERVETAASRPASGASRPSAESKPVEAVARATPGPSGGTSAGRVTDERERSTPHADRPDPRRTPADTRRSWPAPGEVAAVDARRPSEADDGRSAAPRRHESSGDRVEDAAWPRRPAEASEREPRARPVEVARVVPAGTALELRTLTEVHTRSTPVGGEIEARVAQAVYAADGSVLVPAGAVARGRVVDAEHSRRAGPDPRIEVAFGAIELDGRTYPIEATPVDVPVERVTRGGGRAAKIAGGAAIGGLLGRVIGGGARGTLAGAAIGAAAGTAVATGTARVDAVMPRGTTIVLRLDQPLELPPIRTAVR